MASKVYRGFARVDMTSMDSFVVRNRKREVILQRGMEKVHKQAVILLHQWIQQNFEKEGGMHEDRSLKWEDIKDITKRLRKNPNPPFMILQDTGKLRSNWDLLTKKSGGRVKSRTIYSSTHEYGDPSENIPKRKIFPTVKQGEKILKPVYTDFIKDKIINIGKGQL